MEEIAPLFNSSGGSVKFSGLGAVARRIKQPSSKLRFHPVEGFNYLKMIVLNEVSGTHEY